MWASRVGAYSKGVLITKKFPYISIIYIYIYDHDEKDEIDNEIKAVIDN